jgi:plasmid stability protein
MRFSVDLRQGYLRAELFGRETADEMREFLRAVLAACEQHGCPRILMAVRSSRVIFKADDYGLSCFAPGLVSPACQIALLGDSDELHAAHEYIELVARQQQINARAFRDEASALHWLEGSPEPSRRYRFTRIVLLGAPDDAGVYALWDQEELVYYGRAMGGGLTVRARLLEHFDGHLPSESVSHYSWELSADPAAREAQLLAEYQRVFGRPPRLNAAA